MTLEEFKGELISQGLSISYLQFEETQGKLTRASAKLGLYVISWSNTRTSWRVYRGGEELIAERTMEGLLVALREQLAEEASPFFDKPAVLDLLRKLKVTPGEHCAEAYLLWGGDALLEALSGK